MPVMIVWIVLKWQLEDAEKVPLHCDMSMTCVKQLTVYTSCRCGPCLDQQHLPPPTSSTDHWTPRTAPVDHVKRVLPCLSNLLLLPMLLGMRMQCMQLHVE